MSGPACVRCGQRLRAEGTFCHRCGLRAGGAFDPHASRPAPQRLAAETAPTPRRKGRAGPLGPIVAVLLFVGVITLFGLLTSIRSVRTGPVTGTLPHAIQRDIQHSIESIARSAEAQRLAEARRQAEAAARDVAEQQKLTRQEIEQSLEQARARMDEVTRRLQQERIVRPEPGIPSPWRGSASGAVTPGESERAWKMITDALLRGELMTEEQVRRLLGAPQRITRSSDVLGRSVWVYERPTAGSVVFWPDGRVAQAHTGRTP